MNPNAKPFSFNPTASSWAPPAPPAASGIAPGLSIPPTPPAVVQEQVKVEEIIEKTEELAVTKDEQSNAAPDDEDALDENDPLWIATLKVSNGDREAALRLLDDPDALLAYPEIMALMESGEGGGDVAEDWEESAKKSGDDDEDDENDDEDDDDDDDGDEEVKVKRAVVKPQKPGKKVVEEEEEEEEEGDPREHMNIVFIGHVDAGKSTLSGSILYLMGKVDSRTIERFEKEAKNRNRESWFLAFIMDTSEEERAKGKTVEVCLIEKRFYHNSRDNMTLF